MNFKPLFLSVLLLTQPLAAFVDQPAPEIRGISHWLNVDKPLTPADLKGKVVLIDFWTYSCINCIRTFPHVKTWHEKYARDGLVIIGVHTPEFEFEKDPANIQMALKKYGISYPVALDNDQQTWNAFENRYWPAHYFIDRKGVIRFEHFGEGNYKESEKWIRKLLAEGGPSSEAPPTQLSEPDFSKIKSPEVYLGTDRLEVLGNPDIVSPGQPHLFTAPKTPELNKVYLAGMWRIQPQFAYLEKAPGKLFFRYQATKANAVFSVEATKEALAEIWLDGKPLDEKLAGDDVRIEHGRAVVHLNESRLYNLTNTARGGEHLLEIRLLTPNVKIYTLTFG